MNKLKELLIKNVCPVDDQKEEKTRVDLLIKDGIIVKISEAGKKPDSEKHGSKPDIEIFDGQGAFVSPGWMDMHVHFREPGFEHKETIQSGCAAAVAGGFTAVACMPNTNPPLHTRDVIHFVLERAKGLPVTVYPIGTVSKNREGKTLAEMADMKEGGAVAFSDDGDPVQDSRLMRTALEYASMLNVPVINHEEDLPLSRPGYMHEGRVSTRLGLAGSPSIAEEIMIARDIMLAELTGGHLHVAHLSTHKGMQLIREAKQKAINITTEVCPHHFDLTDEEIERQNFNTNWKMHPPLRTDKDIEAMAEGLADGTIDAICTDHAPHSVDEKEVEFIYAPNGIIGLETAFGIVCKRLFHSGKLSLPKIIEKMAVNPRKILNLPVPRLAPGEMANFTLFDPNKKWVCTKESIRSRSVNTPYLGEKMTGKAIAIYNNGQFVINE